MVHLKKQVAITSHIPVLSREYDMARRLEVHPAFKGINYREVIHGFQ